MRSGDDVHDELAAKDIPHEIVHLPSSSKTAQLAAEALGVDSGTWSSHCCSCSTTSGRCWRW